ncbi:MAG: hypothetical protein J2P14_11900 [Acidothermales bacterium]|nr:hypothetical protein [Acidothermales bacterium]
MPLDEDTEHASYVPDVVGAYFASATRAALVLAAFRAPYRGRSTPVNAWWGSFDLAVNLFSGAPAAPPSEDFIMRNAMDAQEVAVGWWPGSPTFRKAAFYAYAHPAPDGFAAGGLSPREAHRDEALGEYVLDWDDVVGSREPHGFAPEFAPPSSTRVRCATGIRRCRPARSVTRRRSAEPDHGRGWRRSFDPSRRSIEATSSAKTSRR